MFIETVYSSELYHHGVKGMKWGVRKYQNEDGSLTDAGRKAYFKNGSHGDFTKRGIHEHDRQTRIYNSYRNKIANKMLTDKGYQKVKEAFYKSELERNKASTTPNGRYSDSRFDKFIDSSAGQNYLKNRDAYDSYTEKIVKDVLKDAYDAPMSELLDYTQRYISSSFGEHLTKSMQNTYIRELYVK